jgi:excisionase family DNA binding protein
VADKWEPGRLLDLEQVAQFLGVSKQTVYSWVQQDRIPVVRIDRRLRFDIVEIDKWLRRLSSN